MDEQDTAAEALPRLTTEQIVALVHKHKGGVALAVTVEEAVRAPLVKLIAELQAEISGLVQDRADLLATVIQWAGAPQ